MYPSFQERQKFTQVWLRVPLLLSALLPVFGVYRQLIQGKPFGNNPMSDTGLILFTVSMLGLIALFAIMRLEPEIDGQGIRMHFIPFVKKKVSWEEIKSASVVDYGFVGGWGIRFGTRYGTVFNITGSKGLAVELKNGKRFCIGTQKEGELRVYIKEKMISTK